MIVVEQPSPGLMNISLLIFKLKQSKDVEVKLLFNHFQSQEIKSEANFSFVSLYICGSKMQSPADFFPNQIINVCSAEHLAEAVVLLNNILASTGTIWTLSYAAAATYRDIENVYLFISVHSTRQLRIWQLLNYSKTCLLQVIFSSCTTGIHRKLKKP